MSSNKRKEVICFGDRRGFALITAILAIMILMALGFLALSVTTGDLKITSRVVGEKKAISGAETGIHQMMQRINVMPVVNWDTLPAVLETNQQVNAATDPNSRYTFGSIRRAPGPAAIPMPGYSIAGGQSWVQQRFMGSATGVNTNYNSSVTIDVGLGYYNPGGDTMSR
jgi:Tfp pilus assembly protein PilX